MNEINSTLGMEISIAAAHMVHTTETKCFNMHGHTWKVELEITGDVQKDGMVVDFNKIKEFFNMFDHKVWFPEEFTDCQKLEDYRDLMFNYKDCVFIPVPVITCENMAQYFADELIARFPQLAIITIRLYEGGSSYATGMSYVLSPGDDEDEDK